MTRLSSSSIAEIAASLDFGGIENEELKWRLSTFQIGYVIVSWLKGASYGTQR